MFSQQLNKRQKQEGWQLIKFEEIAEQISKRINPTPEDSARYIGLEHLDSGSIRVSRWGTDITLKGQKLEMRKGDILFAKRNAYLKRVAIAPIDGIFSAHGMIIRPQGSLVIPKFLPFFMQSDLFMERAISISEGSLSPTIKWKTLSKQIFPFPPIEKQKEMLKVYLQFEETLLKNKNTKNFLLQNKNYLFDELSEKESSGQTVKLSDCIESSPEYGANTHAIELTNESFRIIRVTDIKTDGSLDESLKAGAEKKNNAKYLLNTDDLLIARTGSVGKSFLYDKNIHGEAIFAGYLLRLKFNKSKMLPNFFKHYTDTKKYWHWVEMHARGAVQQNINAKQLERMKISKVPLDKQKLICKLLDNFYRNYEKLKEQESLLIKLKQKYSNHSFSH